MPAPLLSIRHLSVAYDSAAGRTPAIRDLSLDIAAGDSFGLVGESGCGKSTLAMAIMGYLGRTGRILEGAIDFEGTNLVGAPAAVLERVRGARIGMVYQEPASALNPTMTIGRQLMEVPRRHGASAQAARAQALRVLADVEMPDPAAMLGAYPHEVSGGQKQRVVIAMALLANPALLLLDEPTTGLDVTVEASVLDLVNALRHKYGTAVIYISHNLGVIAKVCARVGVMYAGELVELASTRDLFARPRHPYTRGLLACIPRLGGSKRSRTLVPIPGQLPGPQQRPPGCIFAPRCVHVVAGLCDAGPIPLEATAPDHQARCVRWRDIVDVEPAVAPQSALANAPAGAALDVRNLSKFYEVGGSALAAWRKPRRLAANEDLTFTVPRGRILAIVGESGSGKTTFGRIVAGLLTASDGAVAFEGADIAKLPVRRRSRAQVRAIQMVFQNPDGTLNPSHPVGQPVARALRKFGMARGRRAVADQVDALFALVRLPASVRHRKPRQLSGGQKQRVAIARAFAGNPALVLADEPVSALDVSVQAAIVNLMLRIQETQKTTMVWISHDLALVHHLADEVVVLYLGKVMEMGPVDAIFAPPYHPYTEALLAAVPLPDPDLVQQPVRLTGDRPSRLDLPPGCRFATRCPRKLGAICEQEPPPLQEAAAGHWIACHIPVAELALVRPVLREA